MNNVMPVDAFQNIVLVVANQTFMRYWMHWNYPSDPQMMVIQTRDSFDDLLNHGFRKDESGINRYYIFKENNPVVHD